MTAMSFRVPKMDSIESSMGSTKQPESCPPGSPALTRVGELGRKSRSIIIRRKASAVRSTSASLA